MVLSHEDETQIRHSPQQVAQFAVVWIISSWRSWLKAMRTDCLTEAVSNATLSSSKQLLHE